MTTEPARTRMSPDLNGRDPAFIRSVGLPFCAWLRDTYFRATFAGDEAAPQPPFIAVVNHGGGPMLPDIWPLLAEFWERYPIEHPSYALIHDAPLKMPGLGRALTKLGAIRASRAAAERVVESGGVLLIAPGGDVEALRSFGERNKIDLRGHSFFVELAIRAQVPILPVVNVGGHESYAAVASSARLARLTGLDRALRVRRLQLNLGLPWGIWAGGLLPYLPLPTKIDYQVVEPIDPPTDRDLADNPHVVRQLFERVEAAMQDAVDGLAARRRWPVIG